MRARLPDSDTTNAPFRSRCCHFIATGLSWLIGGSLAEVLTSIIFLFIKHPYDVGDRVTIGDKTYTVKEMRLLSTIFLDSNACQVQAPNTWMNTQLIHNIRRSPQVSC